MADFLWIKYIFLKEQGYSHEKQLSAKTTRLQSCQIIIEKRAAEKGQNTLISDNVLRKFYERGEFEIKNFPTDNMTSD